MARKRDYYEVLEVTREVTVSELTKVYRKLAMQYHPDRNPGDAEAADKFREVSEAYEVLRDPEKRSRYDRYGHAGLEGMSMPDFGDASTISDLFGDLFGSLFGGGGGRRRRSEGGRDLGAEVVIDLVEAARGVTKTIPVRRPEKCSKCSGSGIGEGGEKQTCRTCDGRGAVLQGMGFISIQRPCSTCGERGYIITKPCKGCNGKGRVLVETEEPIDIPAGVDSGMTLIANGKGEAGSPPGDLHVQVSVRPHEIFERHGDDLVCRIPVTFSQAALGSEIEVPTVEGKPVRHKLKRGTQSHSVVTIPRQGMPDVHGRGRGSLLVQIMVETPSKLTSRQEELLRELAELDEVNVTPERKGWFAKVKELFRDNI